jgi:hypothetical protein
MCLSALLCLVWIMPLTAATQDRGKISLFGGYSYATDLWDGNSGGKASIAGNVMNHLDLVADLSLISRSKNFNWGSNKYRGNGFFFGPRFHSNGKRWTPFFHTLVGRYWDDRKILDSIQGHETSYHHNSLAVELGGGLDLRASKRISLRLFQLDVVGIRHKDIFGNSGFSGFGSVSFGAVFHLNKVSNNR